MPWKKEERICERCGCKYMGHFKRRFCSFKCSNTGKNVGKIRTEETKNKLRGLKKSAETIEKIRASSTGRIQSIESRRKKSLKFRGEKNHQWKGGITKIRRVIRRGLEFRLWKEKVFKRDNYTCQVCSKRGGDIEADHIKMFSTILNENKITTLEQALLCKELWDTNNGQVLCKKCHKIKTKNDRLKLKTI